MLTQEGGIAPVHPLNLRGVGIILR